MRLGLPQLYASGENSLCAMVLAGVYRSEENWYQGSFILEKRRSRLAISVACQGKISIGAVFIAPKTNWAHSRRIIPR